MTSYRNYLLQIGLDNLLLLPTWNIIFTFKELDLDLCKKFRFLVFGNKYLSKFKYLINKSFKIVLDFLYIKKIDSLINYPENPHNLMEF